MKASSSPWDWENIMLFPNRGTDIEKRDQWENETGGGGDTLMDDGSVHNGYVYFPGCGSLSKVEPDLCEIKTGSMESSDMKGRNVDFLDLRSQVGSRTDESEREKSYHWTKDVELNGDKHCCGTKEHQQPQMCSKDSKFMQRTRISKTWRKTILQ